MLKLCVNSMTGVVIKCEIFENMTWPQSKGKTDKHNIFMSRRPPRLNVCHTKKLHFDTCDIYYSEHARQQERQSCFLTR